MFISPCSLRSAQCAALIALATVSGIARVELNHLTQRPAVEFELPAQTRHETRQHLHPLSYTAPSCTTPWLQPVATVALWYFSSHTAQRACPPADDLVVAESSHASDSAFFTTAANANPEFPLLASSSCSSPIRLRSEPVTTACTLRHLIPFAVGPPAFVAHSTLRAVGTAVPADNTVRCSIVTPVVSFQVSSRSFSRSVARLACPKSSDPISVGPFSSPSSALRGEPAPFSAPSASVRRSARPLSPEPTSFST